MPKSSKGAKNSEGGRNDPAWKYCVQLEMDEAQKGKGYVYVQCYFCGKRITGGVARLKHHLAKTGKNVKGCAQVPTEVLNEMKAILSSNEEKNRRAMMEMEELCRAGSFEMQSPFGGDNQAVSPSGCSNLKRVRGPMDFFVAGPSPLGNPSPTTTIGVSGYQTTLNETWKKEERSRVCRSIGRFFFENGLAFNCASSPSFSSMLHVVGSFGRGLKPPSAYELRGWILKEEVKSIGDIMSEAKASWAETGCNIMSDGWTDVKGRSLINFLVNNPKGTWFLKSVDASDKVKNATLLFNLLDEIVEEVGEGNVIQVITDNASNYKAAGQMLMEKRKHLYWTPCAAHCIDLMLEDILKLPLPASVFKKAKRIINYIYAHGWVLAMVRKQIGGDLVRPAVTRFATAFLTLQKLMSMKDPLESFFTSSKWKKSPYASKPQGKSVSQTILRSKTFWPGVAYVIQTTKPLVLVLRMVDSEKYPPMGFIYEAMDRAKEEMAKALGNDETKYRTLWDIVDDRWDRQLHTNLHAAAYFLNPQCTYEPSFSKYFEIKKGLFDCIMRLVDDPSAREKIDLQIDAFKHARGFFGWESAISTRKKRSPADWWSQFGDECPELQKFAIRVLSLTCSALGCERNWSSFNHVHTKRRNRLTQAKLNDLVYVMFNLKLKHREIRRKTMEDPLCLDDVDSGDEWVSELQSCDFEAFQELDANTPIEDDVVEVEDEADGQGNSRQKRRKDKGTTMNYFLDNRINRAEILFPGVGCFLIAVCLGSAVHSSNAADNKEKLSDSYMHKSKTGATQLAVYGKNASEKGSLDELENGSGGLKSSSNLKEEKPKVGSAEFLIELENQRSIKVFGSSTFIGLGITFFAGVCFSLFSPAFNLATNDQWHTLKEGVPHLVVYTAFFYFSVSCFVLAIVLNIWFLYKPVLGLPKSSFTAYLNDWNGRHWALLAGLLCGFGNGFQFMGGQAAGYAAADAVQALPLVSTFWGIFLFGEYRRSSKKTYTLLVSMLLMFIVAVAVLMASSGHRKT